MHGIWDPQALKEDFLPGNICEDFAVKINIENIGVIWLLHLLDFTEPALREYVPDLKHTVCFVQYQTGLKLLLRECHHIPLGEVICDKLVELFMLLHICKTVPEQ